MAITLQSQVKASNGAGVGVGKSAEHGISNSDTTILKDLVPSPVSTTLSDIRVAYRDDDLQQVTMFAMVLSFLKFKELDAKQVGKELTAENVADDLLGKDPRPDVVILDGQIGATVKGPEVARLLRAKGFVGGIIGYSGGMPSVEEARSAFVPSDSRPGACADLFIAKPSALQDMKSAIVLAYEARFTRNKI